MNAWPREIQSSFPVTTLLRALGYSTDLDLLNLFGLIEEIEVKSKDFGKSIGRVSVEDVINVETGELLLEKNSELTEESKQHLKDSQSNNNLFKIYT